MKRCFTLFTLLVVLVLQSCEDMVEYSPYDVRVRITDVNASNISKIRALDGISTRNGTFTFAVIADPHTFYADLSDAVSSINANSAILFTVVNGDLTDAGLFREFDWEYHHVSKLKSPFVSVIGNHDYLSNGKEIFEKMYGPSNFSFEFQGTKFVFFDDIVWENDNSRPQFEWLAEQLSNEDAYNHQIVCAHINPGNDQLAGEYDTTFRNTLKNKASLVFCGHNHNYEDNQMDGFRYIVVGSVSKRYYSLVTVTPDTVVTRKINF